MAMMALPSSSCSRAQLGERHALRSLGQIGSSNTSARTSNIVWRPDQECLTYPDRDAQRACAEIHDADPKRSHLDFFAFARLGFVRFGAISLMALCPATRAPR